MALPTPRRPENLRGWAATAKRPPHTELDALARGYWPAHLFVLQMLISSFVIFTFSFLVFCIFIQRFSSNEGQLVASFAGWRTQWIHPDCGYPDCGYLPSALRHTPTVDTTRECGCCYTLAASLTILTSEVHCSKLRMFQPGNLQFQFFQLGLRINRL